jgi:hypothetical protein
VSWRTTLIGLDWFFSSQVGINIRTMIQSARGLPAFLSDLQKFRKLYRGTLTIKPCLHDRYDQSGQAQNEYFIQDLLVAKWINQANPRRHVDVGSRIDGFVAHVASFRELEVLDVRPLVTKIAGVSFRQLDLMDSKALEKLGAPDKCDSLSCLHTIEHFGLGRYGDPIDPMGHKVGLRNLSTLLEPGGILYLSTPVGVARVEFNANRVFDPREIIALGHECGLRLAEMWVIRGNGSSHPIDLGGADIEELAAGQYNLGIFRFEKIALTMSQTGP